MNVSMHLLYTIYYIKIVTLSKSKIVYRSIFGKEINAVGYEQSLKAFLIAKCRLIGLCLELFSSISGVRTLEGLTTKSER